MKIIVPLLDDFSSVLKMSLLYAIFPLCRLFINVDSDTTGMQQGHLCRKKKLFFWGPFLCADLVPNLEGLTFLTLTFCKCWFLLSQPQQVFDHTLTDMTSRSGNAVVFRKALTPFFFLNFISVVMSTC